MSKESRKKTVSTPKTTTTSTAADEEGLKPLPDILNFVLQQNEGSGATTQTGDESTLPDVPPNSVEPVERSVSVYDDDFLSAETEDIELF